MSKLIPKVNLYLKKSSPTILTYISSVGVVVTSVLTAKATPKAMVLLEKSSDEKGEELTKLETLAIAGPVYIPAIVIGASTIACIFGANVLNKKQQASIISAYSLINTSYKEYRNKLIELHGEEADIEIKNAIAREHCDFHQIGLCVPDNKVIFYDEISGESITCYEREIMDAEYHFNRNFTMRGFAMLNEFYDLLGLPATNYGDVAGWSTSSGIMWVDFQHRLIKHGDGEPNCYVIDMVFAPDILEAWEC